MLPTHLKSDEVLISSFQVSQVKAILACVGILGAFLGSIGREGPLVMFHTDFT